MPRWSFVLAMLAVLVVCAKGDAHAAGLNFYWDHCGEGAGGTDLKSWACDSNGDALGGPTFDLQASFVAPAGITRLEGLEIVVDVLACDSPVMPAWWELTAASGCRETSLTAAFAPPASSPCANPWPESQVYGGLAAYRLGEGGPRNARIIIGWGVPVAEAIELIPDQEYYATTLRLDRERSTGADSCVGCRERALLTLNSILLAQPVGTPGGDQVVSNPSSNTFAGWNGGGWPNCRVPTRTATWGRVKSLYR